MRISIRRGVNSMVSQWSEGYDKWDAPTIELHGLRWQSEGYDKWDTLTIELHGLRWQSEGYDKWDTLTIELHGLRWQSELCYFKCAQGITDDNFPAFLFTVFVFSPSVELTGMGILERSLPIQFFKIFHKLKLWFGFGGMPVRRGFFFTKAFSAGLSVNYTRWKTSITPIHQTLRNTV